MLTYTYIREGKFGLVEKPKPQIQHERDAIVKVTHPEYPNLHQNMRLFKTQEGYEDIVWITTYATQCFIGKECLTRRTVDLMDALQSTDRIIAHLHFGNPFVATDAPFVPRVLLGWNSEQCINNTLDILAGRAEAVGTQPYAEYLHFHKKGDIIL
ncbi:MAG: hypothetical protein J6T24_06775 [Clostridia bacterium]|nr:hypothetical protein [Clostridia bacterium]